MTKKKLATITIVVFMLMAIMLSSCSYNVKKSEEEQIGDGRFVADRSMQGMIVTDTETGVQYLFVKYGYGGGMTMLVDENGKPLVKEANTDD